MVVCSWTFTRKKLVKIPVIQEKPAQKFSIKSSLPCPTPRLIMSRKCLHLSVLMLCFSRFIVVADFSCLNAPYLSQKATWKSISTRLILRSTTFLEVSWFFMQALGHSRGFAVQFCSEVLCAVWICLDTFLLRSTCQLCDRVGVDVAPAAVSEGEVELILNRFNLPL